ncbi:hypothetical protein EV193_106120 [Herbihabitans rhizosphaerae]|uniref:Uncharacterized protein n=1 Tax=Herbihabitans rhizosphaerae TaxID=1872711 RepID=A0A4Q7KKY8_9PSEU|nr:hypothetical protein [Herbihabitans rhizosphaerae]RZS36886.1 hypothetical protein EV193_106120 [Herbihabitans rhizosphaerae]
MKKPNVAAALRAYEMAMPPGAGPRFFCRWCVTGVTRNGRRSTMLFDLAPDRAHVVVHPGAVTTHSCILDQSTVDKLAELVDSSEDGSVPAVYHEHGLREIVIGTERRNGKPSLSLRFCLPRNELTILFGDERYVALRDTVAEISTTLATPETTPTVHRYGGIAAASGML